MAAALLDGAPCLDELLVDAMLMIRHGQFLVALSILEQARDLADEMEDELHHRREGARLPDEG